MLSSKRSRVLAAAGVVVVLAVVGFGGWWFFIRDDAPKKASIDQASKTLDEATTTSGSGGSGSSGDSVDGTWAIDPNIGSFDDFSGTYAGFRIKEELATVGGTTAVGRTPGVTGDITIAAKKVTKGSFEVDMTTLKSDQARRDNTIKVQGLETNRFPTSTFEITKPITLPANATSGDQISFSATGDLTLHGVTKSVTIRFDARFKDGEIAIVGNTPIKLADYDIQPPTNVIALSVSDNGTLEFQLFLKKG